MAEQDAFETRLARVLERYVLVATPRIGPSELARSLVALKAARRPMTFGHRRLVGALMAAVLVALAVGLLVAGGATPAPVHRYEGVFRPSGSTNLGLRLQERVGDDISRHAAVLLDDGRVLVVGGIDFDEMGTGAELYDPGAGRFTRLPTRADALYGPAIGLDDGRVLVIGGDDRNTADMFDPGSGVFTPIGTIATRDLLTLARLHDGRVLVVGFESAEVFDPVTGTFAEVGPPLRPLYARSASVLPDGRVLLAGVSTGPTAGLPEAELFDPETGMFSDAGPLVDRAVDTASGLSMPDGRVLFVGGSEPRSSTCDPWLPSASAEVFDPVAGAFTKVGPMSTARSGTTSTVLADGRILVSGGLLSPRGKCEAGSPRALDTAEMFDPASGTFATTGSLTVPRAGHAAVLLEDGRVLVVGGADGASAEVFQ